MAVSEHWLDRLMTTKSRREAMKIALAGAASLTFPFGSLRCTSRQPADGSNACQTGCNYYYGHTAYQADLETCSTYAYNAAGYTASLLAWAYPVPLAAHLAPVAADKALAACQDLALLNAKAHLYDCLTDGCPGFNPKAPDGPCSSCQFNCCTCPKVAQGYICCICSCDDPDHSCC